jgi:hypothetical protein
MQRATHSMARSYSSFAKVALCLADLVIKARKKLCAYNDSKFSRAF